MNRKKVLFVINSLYGGGAEKVFQTIINNLDYSKYEVTVYSLHKEEIDKSIYEKTFNYRGIFYKIGDNANFLEHIFKKIANKIILILYNNFNSRIFYKFFIKGKYDVEIAFIEGYATRIVSGSKNKKSKKIAWIHVDLINTPWTGVAYRSFEEECMCYKKFDRLICVSKDVRKSFKEKYRLFENIFVYYNPVNEKLIRTLSEKRVSISRNNTIQFITIGRLENQKGYKRLVKAVKTLKDKGYTFNIWILGMGSQWDELDNYILTHHLKGFIKLLGYQNNPYPYLKNADAFICSSYSEGYSTVATESLILGKPVLTTDCAGMKELFGNYECGMICDNSTLGIIKMLEYILKDRKVLNDFSMAAKKRGNELKLEIQMKKIEGLIDGE